MSSYLRVSILGFVAGLLALLVWVLVVYLALAIFALAFTLVDELATARAAGMALEGQIGVLLGQSIVASVGNALRGLLDLWGAFVVFGVLGVLAAWSFHAGRLMYPARAWWISFLGVAALIVMAVITWVFAQQEQITLWMAESPETYRWRDILLDSQGAALWVSPIFALAITYPAWSTWRWWFVRLGGSRVFGDNASTAATDLTPAAAEDRSAYTRRLAELKRGGTIEAIDLASSGGAASARYTEEWRRVVHSNLLLGLLVFLLLGGIGGTTAAYRYYEQIALRLQHGSAFVDATTQPHLEFALHIDPDVQRLRIVNINGLGAVSISLRPSGNPTEVVAEASEWAFEWRADEYLYQDIPVQGLTPGDYILGFDQRTGWGYFEYILSQGGGRTSQILAIASGLLLASTVALAAVLAVLAFVRLTTRGTLQDVL